MKCPLAILAPDVIGCRAATFIRRHMQDLLPGGTAVVARAPDIESTASDWTADVPVLDLATIVGGRLRWQLAHAVAKQVGLKLDKLMVERFWKQHQVQVVMGEYLDFGLEWFDVARKSGIRFFGHAHGVDVWGRPRDPRWRSEYLRYNESAGVIAPSRSSRRSEERRVGKECRL